MANRFPLQKWIPFILTFWAASPNTPLQPYIYTHIKRMLTHTCPDMFRPIYIYIYIYIYTSPDFAGLSGICVGWGIKINSRFKVERPPASVEPPSGGRAAFLTPMHPLYNTRPHGLVQAIFWHTCLDLDLGP